MLAVALLRVPESRDENSRAHDRLDGRAARDDRLGTLVYGLIRVQLGRRPHRRQRVHRVRAGRAGALRRRREARAASDDAARHVSLARCSRSRTSTRSRSTLALGGSLYFFPYVLIDVQGYAPTAAGATFLPFVILQFAFSRWSGGLVHRLGARLPLVVGRGARRLRVSSL